MPHNCHTGITVLFPLGESHFLVASKDTANCANAQGSMCLHPTPGQQHEATHGQAQPGLQESLAAALKGRRSHPHCWSMKNQGFLFLGLLCPYQCIAFTASVSPSTVPPVAYLQSTGAET